MRKATAERSEQDPNYRCRQNQRSWRKMKGEYYNQKRWLGSTRRSCDRTRIRCMAESGVVARAREAAGMAGRREGATSEVGV
jgi:hypothetical protein